MSSHVPLLLFVFTGISVSVSQRSRASGNDAPQSKTAKFWHWHVQSASHAVVPSRVGSEETPWAARRSSFSAVSSTKTTRSNHFPSLALPKARSTSKPFLFTLIGTNLISWYFIQYSVSYILVPCVCVFFVFVRNVVNCHSSVLLLSILSFPVVEAIGCSLLFVMYKLCCFGHLALLRLTVSAGRVLTVCQRWLAAAIQRACQCCGEQYCAV